TGKSKSEQENSQSRISAQNSTLNSTELTVELGRTLAQIGDKLNTQYFEEWNSHKNYKRDIGIVSHLASVVARTLSVVLISGWCDNLR
ncbi:Hypothetical predicted protein, partial [Paramuricea clavata]